jgi:hypothetical protein
MGFDARGGWVMRVVCDPEWRVGNLAFVIAG